MNDITSKIPELEPDLTPDNFMQTVWLTPLEWCLAASLMLALIGLIVWRLVARRRKKAVPPPTHEEIALSAIRDIEGSAISLRECCLRLSLILRTYLTGEADDPALYETHQEFNRRVDSLASLPEAEQEEMRRILEYMASVKYAEETMNDCAEVGKLCAEARELVVRIHAARRATQSISAHA